MATSPTTVARADPALTAIRELIDEYGRAHEVEVWFWQRVDGEWSLAAGTSPSPRAAPGESALHLANLLGPPSAVEVECTDAAEAARSTSFLSFILSRALQHAAESRFFGREIAERYEEITLLYTISEILGSVISLDEAAQTILREVTDTMGVVRAALWIYEPTDNSLHLAASVGGNVQPGPIEVDDASSITAAVFRDGRPTMLDPGDIYPRHERHPDPFNRDSFLSVPVNYTPPHGQARTIGVINLMGRRVEEGFSAGDHKLITAIASQIGAAVENSRLVAESLRQERIVREMELAHDLQLKLLPSVEQFRDRAEVAARCVPAESVGGDFYHLFRLPANRVGVMIGDVSSHGFAAALIMALTMSAAAIHASEGDPPAEVLRRVHRSIIEELENTEMYMTLFYGVIDPVERRLRYANAGHAQAFRISQSGAAHRLATTNPPFGVAAPAEYSEDSVEWNPGGDTLFLFTDGLADALGLTDGEQRLVDCLVEDRGRPLEQVLDSLFNLQALPVDIPSDDRTALLLRI